MQQVTSLQNQRPTVLLNFFSRKSALHVMSRIPICRLDMCAAHIVTQKSPIVTPMSPIVTQKSPIVTQKSPIVTQKSPIVTPKSPIVTQKSPMVTQKSPVVTQVTFLESQPYSAAQEWSNRTVAEHACSKV